MTTSSEASSASWTPSNRHGPGARTADSTSPLDRAPARLLRNNGRVPLGHRGLLDKVPALLLHARGVVCEQAGGLDLGLDRRELHLHTLVLRMTSKVKS